MKLNCLFITSVLLVGCAHEQQVGPLSTDERLGAMDGYAVAAALQASYRDTRQNCGSLSTPAFLCSGVLFRGTNESTSYHSWNPVPGRTGVAFSYIRKDANFDHLAVGTDNGFIFYPIFSAPIGKDDIQVLCSFPIDGNSWTRAQPGCGATSYFPNESQRCQSQNIVSASQWKALFDSLPAQYDRETWVYSYICGFDVSDAMNEQGASAFYQSLQAMRAVPATLSHHYNELILQAWAQDIPNRLPIQAFFYTLGSGLAGARHDQWDFFNQTSRTFIPIIRMTLPTSVTGEATFTYNPADQYCQPGATTC